VASFWLTAAVLTSAGFAQSGGGTIAGNVKDAGDSPVPSARVRVVNIESGVTLESITMTPASIGSGRYGLGPIASRSRRPGSIRSPGDRSFLQIGQTLAIDLTLAVGSRGSRS